jgi:peptidoglycan hydrolase-like protein with peptidoglycan-binding domain
MPVAPDPQVSWAQSCLAQSVDPSVPQDGSMGPQTRQAIRTFQTQQQMPPTGILDVNTVTALQTACNPPQAPQPPAGPPPAPPPDPGPPAAAGGGAGGAQRRKGQQEAEFGYRGEFRPERPFHDFHRDEGFREGRDRGRWDRDRRWPWLFQEVEASYDGEAEFWPNRLLSRDIFDVHRDERFREGREGRRWEHDHRRPWLFQEAESGYHSEAESWPERHVFREPFEFHRDERFRGDRERWRWDHDHQRPWLFQETESGYGMQGETPPVGSASRSPGESRPAGSGPAAPASRPPAEPGVAGSASRPPGESRPAGSGPAGPAYPPPAEPRPGGPASRPPAERWAVGPGPERPSFRPPGERGPERPIFRPRAEFRPERSGFRQPFEFRPRDPFRPDIDRLRWDRERRWSPFGRGRRDWAFGIPWERPRVLWAQSCLAQILGSWVLQDGVLGPNTNAAVRVFQEQRQLPQTGMLDGNTVNALHAACGG